MNKTTKASAAPTASGIDHQGYAESNQGLATESGGGNHQDMAPFRAAAPTTASNSVTGAEQYLDGLSAKRRARLAELIADRAAGSAARFAEAHEYSRASVHQFLSATYNGGRSIGEMAARELEHRADLPFGWLDSDTGISALASNASADSKLSRPNFSELSLHPLEVYAGIVQHQGAPAHLILLPADVQVTGLEVAEEFVASISGEFPTYAELQHLRNCMHRRFKPSLYYTCDQEPYDGDMATMLFDMATDDDRKWMTGPRSVRVRAVRRVPAQAGTAGADALSAARVAEIADKLIDQEVMTDDPEPTDDEYLVAAGIKVGVGRMALAIQAELAIYTRKQGGSHA